VADVLSGLLGAAGTRLLVLRGGDRDTTVGRAVETTAEPATDLALE